MGVGGTHQVAKISGTKGAVRIDIDLGPLGGHTPTPYVGERTPWQARYGVSKEKRALARVARV